MRKLVIQIDSSVAGDDFNWLATAIPPKLAPLGLDTQVFVNPKVMPQPSQPLTTSQIFNFTQGLIDHSGLRNSAEQFGDWYIHLFITTEHVSGNYLGLMYDSGFDNHPRHGCAVFWKPVKNLCGSKADFRLVMIRTAIHEIGHCLTLNHRGDGSIMAQTGDLIGPGWIQNIDYSFAGQDVNKLLHFADDCRPGYGDSSSIQEDLVQSSAAAIELLPLGNDEILTGDALSFLVEVTNTGTSKLEIGNPFDPTAGNLKIWIGASGGDYKQVQEVVSFCGQPSQPVAIDVEQARVFPVHLFADRSGYLFKSAGKYKLKIALRVIGGEWLICESGFTVLAPSGEEMVNKAVYSAELVRFIALSGTEKKETRRHALKLISGNPKSAISRSLLWALIYKAGAKAEVSGHGNNGRFLSELLRYYRLLERSEFSKLKRGKVLFEIDRLSALLGKKVSKKHMDVDGLINGYNVFEKNQIKRPKLY